MIREEALMSKDLAAISAGAERLFWRLILVADDHGLFIAEPIAVHGRCLPLLPVRTTEVEEWLAEIQHAGIVCLYELEGRHYGHFPSWSKHQRIRAEKSKYPLHEGPCPRTVNGRPRTIVSGPLSNAAVVGVGVEDEGGVGDGGVEGQLAAECGEPAGARQPVEWADLRVRDWLRETKHLRHLADDQYAELWASLERAFDPYPFVYFDEEIRRFDLWLEANPHRKPVKDWKRKVSNWFAKAVEIGQRQQARQDVARRGA